MADAEIDGFSSLPNSIHIDAASVAADGLFYVLDAMQDRAEWVAELMARLADEVSSKTSQCNRQGFALVPYQ
jgi:hypothetical protein